MPTERRRRCLLARHPVGRPWGDDFLFVDDIVPMPPPGKFPVPVIWLSSGATGYFLDGRNIGKRLVRVGPNRVSVNQKRQH